MRRDRSGAARSLCRALAGEGGAARAAPSSELTTSQPCRDLPFLQYRLHHRRADVYCYHRLYRISHCPVRRCQSRSRPVLLLPRLGPLELVRWVRVPHGKVQPAVAESSSVLVSVWQVTVKAQADSIVADTEFRAFRTARIDSFLDRIGSAQERTASHWTTLSWTT